MNLDLIFGFYAELRWLFNSVVAQADPRITSAPKCDGAIGLAELQSHRKIPRSATDAQRTGNIAGRLMPRRNAGTRNISGFEAYVGHFTGGSREHVFAHVFIAQSNP